jgi:hypothetical protein
MATPDLVSFTAECSISGLNKAVNTWHVGVTPTTTASEVNSILGAVKTFYDAWAPYRQSGFAYTIGNRVLHWPKASWQIPTGRPGLPGYVPGRFLTPPVIVGATAVNSTAGTGGLPVPPQLAAVVSWRTPISGRTGRGRTYLGVLGANGINQNVLLAGFVSAQITAGATLLTNLNAITLTGGGTASLEVWSPTKGYSNAVIQCFMDNVVDTMRSRVK